MAGKSYFVFIHVMETLAFDCAHGASAPILHIIDDIVGNHKWQISGDVPDGLNINEGVGVMNMAYIATQVKNSGAKVGVAYDGDADRVLLTDSQGRILDGDIILWVLARWLAGKGKLGNGVVATVMSNLSLEEHLKKHNIGVFRCPVGDIRLEMMKYRAYLGGTLLLFEFTSTGDGIVLLVYESLRGREILTSLTVLRPQL